MSLLLRTGKRTTICEREPRPGCVIAKTGQLVHSDRPSYQLHVWEDSDISMLGPNNAKSCLKYEHYKGEVFCAKVPNETLITRRNDSIFVSGSSV